MNYNMTLDDYLENPLERLEYERIETILKESRRKNSPWAIEYYTSRGKSEDEAKILIDHLRKKRKKPMYHPGQVEFYIRKGLSQKDAKTKVSEYRNKIGKIPSLEEYVSKYGKLIGIEKWEQYQKKIKNREKTFISKFNNILEGKIVRSIKKGFGNTKTCRVDLNDFKSYSRACRLLTKLGLIIYKDILDPTGKKLGREYGKSGYTLDHKFSIYGGFYHKIDPFKIASYNNLRIISSAENSQKSQFCIIDKDAVENFPTLLDEECLSTETKELINNVFDRTS